MLGYYDILEFGKHKGKQVASVLVEEPDYILWLNLRTKHKFERSILQHAERLLNEVDRADYNNIIDLWDSDIMDRD